MISIIKYLKVFAAAVLLLLQIPCWGQDGIIRTVKGNKIKVEEFEKFVTSKMDSLKVAGLSVAIINDRKVVYNDGFGYTNLETRCKVSNETLFEAASLSKPLFAYFVMKQVEKGVFDLDKPLYTYLPNEEISYDDRYRLITGRMVLCHASGFPNWREPGRELKILFTPGTKYNYSGEGYQYLKNVIKHILKVNDVELDSLIQEEIVVPIGAKKMRFSWDESLSSLKAFGHINGVPTDNGPIGRPEEWYFNAASSLLTNAADYCKFLIEIMDQNSDKTINRKILHLQQNMPPVEDGKFRSVAFPYKLSDGRIRYYHTGINRGTRAYCHFYPENGYGIVMLSNCDNFMSSQFASILLEYLDEEVLY